MAEAALWSARRKYASFSAKVRSPDLAPSAGAKPVNSKEGSPTTQPLTRSATKLAIKVGIENCFPRNTSAHRQKPAPQHHRPHLQRTTFRFLHHPRLSIQRRQRDRTGASIGGDHLSPSCDSTKAPPPPSLLSARRTDPAKHHPQPATHTEAINLDNGATIRKSSHATADCFAASTPSAPHPGSTTTDLESPAAATP